MFNEPHDLYHEFPEYQEKIHELKSCDPGFGELFTEYHKLDDEIHRIAIQLETPSDFYVEKLKKSRLYLKDRIYSLLQQAHA
ncbi:MAG: GTP-binding protein [Beggiatoa sp. IS2]|nr:MAG: GTP-binding protein [Beggiatoa sp. IS2]